MLAILTEWLKDTTRSVGIGSNVVLAASGDALAARSVEAGETLLELRSGACLTARAAYADREMGRDLQEIAAQNSPRKLARVLAAMLTAQRGLHTSTAPDTNWMHRSRLKSRLNQMNKTSSKL